MTHLSEHDLWGTGGNLVVPLPPTTGDVFVVVTVSGAVALLWPVNEYDRAVEVAERFARRLRAPQPATIKVLAVTLREAQAFGFLPSETMPTKSPEQDAEDRKFAVGTLWRSVRESNDAAIRTEALDLLKQLGELP